MRFIFIPLLILGCSSEAKPTTAAKVTDEKYEAYKAGMLRLLDEAASICKAMDLSPDRASLQKRITTFEEMLSRVPDCPVSQKATGDTWDASAKSFLASFTYASIMLKLESDFERLNAEADATKTRNEFVATTRDIRKSVESFKAAINSNSKFTYKTKEK